MSCDLPTRAVLAACPGGTPGWAEAGALCGLFGLRNDGTAEPWRAFALWVTAAVLKECPEYPEPVADWARVSEGGPNHWVPLLAMAADAGPPPTVAITAGRYLAVHHRRRAFDLKTGRTVETIPNDWLVTLVLNLRTLHAACLARAQKWTPKPPPSGPTPTPPPSA